jgi:hypothetical protein
MSITLNVHGRNIRIAEKDRQRIEGIVSRAVDELVTLFLRGDLFGLMADLALCRRQLDLEQLYAAGKNEFFQEVIRINRSIDRKTGRLPEGFTPRYPPNRKAVKA